MFSVIVADHSRDLQFSYGSQPTVCPGVRKNTFEISAL